MRRILLLFAALISFDSAAVKAFTPINRSEKKHFGIFSPDKKIRAVFKTDGRRLTYELRFEGKQIILPSDLGLKINGENIGQNVSVTLKKTSFHSTNIKWPLGEDAIIDNTYNEFELVCRSKSYNYKVMVRVYNGSLAFRYVVPQYRKSRDN
ncbi:glycoside hydrolase family 97 N-terminal domain-containing protein [Mucilaginibacter terrae]|uniref:Glycosyl-hydrolase 97 N-terminal domain-containing protein n=1 Tax=Mucilaginibacter terrae TaxID=1955052 RepID=A0ABU3GN11_9SPHI|nr:glycoside hydrolase family 97 N-terminal domain-containing protein [Mucilaginibacter terrae]MDT3401161.1 hypothetical protein [Mucilaginibacter terrae]